MAELFIKGIKLNVKVGIYEKERSTPQKILLDCKLRIDNISHTEDISSVCDYENLVKTIKSEIEPVSFNLIETLADRVVEICLRYVSWVEVCVSKEFYLGESVSYRICSKN